MEIGRDASGCWTSPSSRERAVRDEGLLPLGARAPAGLDIPVDDLEDDGRDRTEPTLELDRVCPSELPMDAVRESGGVGAAAGRVVDAGAGAGTLELDRRGMGSMRPAGLMSVLIVRPAFPSEMVRLRIYVPCVKAEGGEERFVAGCEVESTSFREVVRPRT